MSSSSVKVSCITFTARALCCDCAREAAEHNSKIVYPAPILTANDLMELGSPTCQICGVEVDLDDLCEVLTQNKLKPNVVNNMAEQASRAEFENDAFNNIVKSGILEEYGVADFGSIHGEFCYTLPKENADEFQRKLSAIIEGTLTRNLRVAAERLVQK